MQIRAAVGMGKSDAANEATAPGIDRWIVPALDIDAAAQKALRLGAMSEKADPVADHGSALAAPWRTSRIVLVPILVPIRPSLSSPAALPTIEPFDHREPHGSTCQCRAFRVVLAEIPKIDPRAGPPLAFWVARDLLNPPDHFPP